MTVPQVVLLAYAVLLVVGGIAGYATAGSRASLAAGLASGLLLAAAWGWSRGAPAAGYALGALVALALCVTFGMRLAKTGKWMPSGMLLLVSVVACLVLAMSSWRARR